MHACIVSVLFFSLLFFFFKQKTAYEMRISDWSSDVCSSDLILHPPAGRSGFYPDKRRAHAPVHFRLGAAFGRHPPRVRGALRPPRAGTLWYDRDRDRKSVV